MIADTPELINAYQLLALKGALKMESLGMMHSRGSVAGMVRSIIKSKTKNKTALLAEYIQHLKSINLLQS
jgi:hypothetical protein